LPLEKLIRFWNIRFYCIKRGSPDLQDLATSRFQICMCDAFVHGVPLPYPRSKYRALSVHGYSDRICTRHANVRVLSHPWFSCTRGREGRKKIRRKNRGPSTLLKYVPTAYFLLPLAKLLPLTNGPKKWVKLKDKGYYLFSSYFLLLLWLTDWAQPYMNSRHPHTHPLQ
jgi:hypothetical protein